MDKKLAKRIGKRISYWRRQRGLVSEKLAQENDISKGYMSDIENGNKLPNLSMLSKITDALDVDIKDLF